MREAIRDGVDLVGYACRGPIEIVPASTAQRKKRYGFLCVDKADEEYGSLARIRRDRFDGYRHAIETNGKSAR